MLRWKASLKPANSGTPNGLLDNLIGAWELDETSGNAIDSKGSNDLTDTNTVGSTTGVISNARDFVAANSEYFTSSTMPVTGTVARSSEIWFKTSDTATQYIYAWGNDSGSNSGAAWRLSIEAGTLRCRVYNGAANFGGSWADGSWHHSVMQVKASGVVTDIELYVDGASQTQTGGNSRAINTNNGSGTDSFNLGTNIVPGSYFNGQADMLRIWNRELTTDDISTLYNSGSGLAYSSFTAS